MISLLLLLVVVVLLVLDTLQTLKIVDPKSGFTEANPAIRWAVKKFGAVIGVWTYMGLWIATSVNVYLVALRHHILWLWIPYAVVLIAVELVVVVLNARAGIKA